MELAKRDERHAGRKFIVSSNQGQSDVCNEFLQEAQGDLWGQESGRIRPGLRPCSTGSQHPQVREPPLLPAGARAPVPVREVMSSGWHASHPHISTDQRPLCASRAGGCSRENRPWPAPGMLPGSPDPVLPLCEIGPLSQLWELSFTEATLKTVSPKAMPPQHLCCVGGAPPW